MPASQPNASASTKLSSAMISGAVRDARGDHAAVRVADEDDVAQILVLEHRQYILNMGFKVYVAIREMRPFAEAGECRCEKFVPPRGHERPHLFPRPASSPTAMGHEINGQRILLRRNSNFHVAGAHLASSIAPACRTRSKWFACPCRQYAPLTAKPKPLNARIAKSRRNLRRR
jgi:hypothetical protein